MTLIFHIWSFILDLQLFIYFKLAMSHIIGCIWSSNIQIKGVSKENQTVHRQFIDIEWSGNKIQGLLCLRLRQESRNTVDSETRTSPSNSGFETKTDLEYHNTWHRHTPIHTISMHIRVLMCESTRVHCFLKRAPSFLFFICP